MSDVERNIISLPVRFGGLGIANPSENSEREYNASLKVTKGLSDMILKQEQDLTLYNQEAVDSIVKDLKKSKDEFLSDKFDNILSSLGDNEMLKKYVLN